MFKVRGKLILTPEIDVIESLRNELHRRGIYKLNKIKKLKSNIMVCCPIHNNGQEKSPSCGISIGENAGIVHCFTCGYGKGNPVYIDDFVSHCFGFNDRGRYGGDWLLKNFVVGVASERKSIKRIEKNAAIESAPVYVDQEELESYRFTHEYHYERKLTDEIIELFDLGFDKNFRLKLDDGTLSSPIECITFPVFDLHGNCVFVARRAINTKLFHYPDNIEKPVYGAHLIDDSVEELYVCESAINALTCWVYGKKAVALLGLGTKYQYDILRKLPVRKIIIAMDGDSAGTQAIGRLRNALKNSRKLIAEINLPYGKDINDLSKEEFLSLKQYY